MKSTTAFVLGIAVSSVVYIAHETSNVIYTKKQHADQLTQHLMLVSKICEVVQNTSYEIFCDQYVRILTNTYRHYSFTEYNEIIDDINFIIYQPVPPEFILDKLETYMVVLDVLQDIRISKKNKNLKET